MTQMSLDQWKAWAAADAERRGLHALKPLLEGLAASTERLRATSWRVPPDGAPPAQTSPAGDDDVR